VVKKNLPLETIRVEGREFSIFQEYDEGLEELYVVYPDFESNPECTDEGWPFATAGQESCAHCMAKTSDEPLPEDCGGCGWFFRAESPYDIIGVCKCEELKRVV